MKKLSRIFRSKKGQSLVEYALIITLVSIAVLATLGAMGGLVDTQFAAIVASL